MVLWQQFGLVPKRRRCWRVGRPCTAGAPPFDTDLAVNGEVAFPDPSTARPSLFRAGAGDLNRMQDWTCLIVLAMAAVTSACTSTTMPAAVGVVRSQSIWAPASPINNYASQQYAKEKARAQQEGRLNVDPELTRRVRKIAERVHAQVGAFRPLAVSWAWEVNVISSEEINAYGRAGGKILIMSEMFTKLALTDDEIAFVLGHETAHALREHTRETVSYAALIGGLSQAANKDPNKMMDLYHNAIPHPAESEMEVEADLIGMELSARAGYDPKGALSFIDKLQRNGGASKHAFSRAHPGYERRKQRLREVSSALSGLSKSSR